MIRIKILSITKYSYFLLFFIFIIILASNVIASSTRLAFVANLDGNWDLFTINEDGTDLKRLTKTPFDEKQPSWFRDRTKIVYATSDGKLHMIRAQNGEEIPLEIESTTVPRLSPSLSPDDNKLAFIQFVPKKKDDTDLILFDFKTKKTQTLIHQYSGQFWPSWSPDGRYIVYINSHCSGDCGRLIQELWITDSRGGWARQLLMTNSFCQQPSWSPNGKKIAFSSDKNGNFDIWILDLDSWDLRQVTNFNGLDISPAWSPDGNRLAFISIRSGGMEIWLKNLDTGEIKRIRPFGNKLIECKDVAWW